MEDLRSFMMLFRFEPKTGHQPTKEELDQQRQQWGSFIGNLAIKEKLVSTYQLSFEGKRLSSDLSISEGIDMSAGMTLGGNMIVKTKTLDEAVELAKDCPILKIGGTVEVRSIRPMES